MKYIAMLILLACSTAKSMTTDEVEPVKQTPKPSVLIRAKMKFYNYSNDTVPSRFKRAKKVRRRNLEITEWYVIPKEEKS